ncbi:MAG TPA: multicopper oxidase family protein [Acidiferrobacteraceae bacterium]|nr:multicopper oxidase family protein [Acidiferrobacteraceae bacterium]
MRTLTAAPLRYQPRAGLTVSGLAYNGQVPGPVLEVQEGAQLRVHFRNRSGAPSTIHWHGLVLPNAMDGVPGVTQPAVPDGGDFEYHFRAEPAGTRWYHSHVSPQLAQGLFGALIIREAGVRPPAHEVVAVLHDIPDWDSYRAAMAGTSTATAYTPPGIAGAMSDMAAMSNMGGMQMPKMGDEVRYRAHCLNGHAQARWLAVQEDDAVRLRLINASPTETRYVRLAGHRFSVTHTDGNPLPHAVEVEVLRLGPAERLDALVHVRGPGAFMLAGLTRPGTLGEQGLVLYTPGYARSRPQIPAADLRGVSVFSYRSVGGKGVAVPPASGTVHRTLLLGQRGRYWTIDGAIWPHTPRLRPPRGARIRLHWRNHTDMDHPMHLHGHRFELLAINGQWLARPLIKDTVLVPAHGSADWQFVADEYSGRWLLHCHNEIHMMDGMSMEVDY